MNQKLVRAYDLPAPMTCLKKGPPRFLINAAAPVGPDLQAAAEPAQTERPVRLLQVPDPDYTTLSFVFYGR